MKGVFKLRYLVPVSGKLFLILALLEVLRAVKKSMQFIQMGMFLVLLFNMPRFS